jgi:predicted RNA-binding protein with PUA-like domain
MSYWLVKSEPEAYSIEDFERDRVTRWDCVRNYQARNNLQAMQSGDRVLFYRSSKDPAILGEAEVSTPAYPDPLQFDSKSEYFDAQATPEKPRWFSPDLTLRRSLPMLSLEHLKKVAMLKDMVLFKNSRLSVQPLTKREYEIIMGLCGVK